MTGAKIRGLDRWSVLIIAAIALGLLISIAAIPVVRHCLNLWFFPHAVSSNKWRTIYWSDDILIKVITDNGVSPRAQQSLVKVSNARGLVAFKMFHFVYQHSYAVQESAERHYFAQEFALLAQNDLPGLLKLGYVTDVSVLDLKIPSSSALPVEQGPPSAEVE